MIKNDKYSKILLELEILTKNNTIKRYYNNTCFEYRTKNYLFRIPLHGKELQIFNNNNGIDCHIIVDLNITSKELLRLLNLIYINSNREERNLQNVDKILREFLPTDKTIFKINAI